MTADTQCEVVAELVVPSLVPGSCDVPPGELEHASVDMNQEMAAASLVGRLSHSVDEGMVSENGENAASSQHQQLPATANAIYISIQEPTLHHLSINLAGNFFIHNDVTAVWDADIVMFINQYCIGLYNIPFHALTLLVW